MVFILFLSTEGVLLGEFGIYQGRTQGDKTALCEQEKTTNKAPLVWPAMANKWPTQTANMNKLLKKITLLKPILLQGENCKNVAFGYKDCKFCLWLGREKFAWYPPKDIFCPWRPPTLSNDPMTPFTTVLMEMQSYNHGTPWWHDVLQPQWG